MKQLARLQRTFQERVLHPGRPGSTAWISANGRAAPEVQLSVYHHAYRARLKEVLASDYPATLMAIGDEHFNRLADDYIRAHPSHYFSLRDFGCHLPDFVSGFIQQDTRYRDMHWLFELTLFEWTLGQTFDAADVSSLTEQDMAALSPEAWPALRFIVHPCVHRLDLEWNTPELWRALTCDKPTQVNARRETASPWLVWREQLITHFRSMQPDEQRALDTLRAGESFNEVCEALATLMHEDEVPLRAAGLLKGWIAQGLISGIQ
jgi:hypothetical protein